MFKQRKTLTVFLSIFTIFWMMASFFGCATTSKDWKAAEQKNTVAGYEMFLQKHPNTEQASKAKYRLSELKIMEDWKNVKSMNTESGYKEFLNKHPESKQANQAMIILDQVESERDWKRTLSSPSITSYNSFIKQYPNSKHIYDAKRKLKQLGWFDPIDTDYAKFKFKIKKVEVLSSLETTGGIISLKDADNTIVIVTINGYADADAGVIRKNDDFLVTYNDNNTVIIEHEVAMENPSMET